MLFSIATAQELQQVWTHSSGDIVWRTAFSPDGSLLIEEASKYDLPSNPRATTWYVRVVNAASGKVVFSRTSDKGKPNVRGDLAETSGGWLMGFFTSDSKFIWLCSESGFVEKIRVSDGAVEAKRELPTDVEINLDRAWLLSDDETLVCCDENEVYLYRFKLGETRPHVLFDYTSWEKRDSNRRFTQMYVLGDREGKIYSTVDRFLYQFSAHDESEAMMITELGPGIPFGVQTSNHLSVAAVFWGRQFGVFDLANDLTTPQIFELSTPLKGAVLTSDRKIVVGYPRTSTHFETCMTLMNLENRENKSYSWGNDPGLGIAFHEETERVAVFNGIGEVTVWQIVRHPD